MWVEINKDIFEDSDIIGLNYIFQILTWFPKEISRYNVFIDLEEIQHTENYNKLKGVNVNFDEFVNQQFNEFILTKPGVNNRDYVISNKKNINNYNIEEAIRFFSQPISIILENNKNDAYFIRALFSFFDSSRKLNEHLENGWIRFENAGGCSNVKNFIQGQLVSYDDLASRNNRNTFDYYRCFIVLDSDKEYESQPQKSNYNNLISYLNSVGINSQKVHILEKRMMENYMPIEVLLELKDSFKGNPKKLELINWINVYINLKDKQRDYLNINSGFSKELDENGYRKSYNQHIKDLYCDVSSANMEILDKGFKYPDFKNLFSELFYTSTRVNKVSLLKRANSEEFKNILDKIYMLI